MLLHPRKVSKFPCSLALLFLLSAPAFCNSISFTFSGNVDATPFGLSASTPFSIQYSYDPNQAPFQGSNAVYPVDFVLTVGGFVSQGHGSVSVVVQPLYDQFELNASGTTSIGNYQESMTGEINGIPVFSLDLDILDTTPPLNMFSTTQLPSSPQFLSSADFLQLQIENFNGSANILQQFAPSDLGLSAQAVPEPGSGWLVAGVLAILMGCRFARPGSANSPGKTGSTSHSR